METTHTRINQTKKTNKSKELKINLHRVHILQNSSSSSSIYIYLSNYHHHHLELLSQNRVLQHKLTSYTKNTKNKNSSSTFERSFPFSLSLYLLARSAACTVLAQCRFVHVYVYICEMLVEGQDQVCYVQGVMSWIDGKGGFSRGLKRPRAGRVEVSGTRPKSQIATWPGHSRPFPHVVIRAWSLRRTRSALGDPVDPRDCLSSDR